MGGPRASAFACTHRICARPAASEGTHFDYHNEFHAPLGPIGAIVSRALVGGIPEREANRTLEQLRAYLEEAGVAENRVRCYAIQRSDVT